MTESNITELTPVYKEDPMDQLSRLSSQLSAMLLVVSVGGFEDFDTWRPDIKQNYLWACSDHAQQIEKVVNDLIFKKIEKVSS